MMATLGFLCDKGLLNGSLLQLVHKQQRRSKGTDTHQVINRRVHASQLIIQIGESEVLGPKILDPVNSSVHSVHEGLQRLILLLSDAE